MIGAVALPISMFWLAWTSYSVRRARVSSHGRLKMVNLSPLSALLLPSKHQSVHWIAPCLSGLLLGIGLILVFLSLFNYIIDTYLMKGKPTLLPLTRLLSDVSFFFAQPVPLLHPPRSSGRSSASAFLCSLRPLVFCSFQLSIHSGTDIFVRNLQLDVPNSEPTNRRIHSRCHRRPLHAHPLLPAEIWSPDSRPEQECRSSLSYSCTCFPLFSLLHFCSLCMHSTACSVLTDTTVLHHPSLLVHLFHFTFTFPDVIASALLRSISFKFPSS